MGLRLTEVKLMNSLSNNKSPEELFWEIFNTNDEVKLHKLVTTHPLLINERNWFPYGGRDENDRGNFSTFENQQPHPIPALVEKITNSIDSLLMKECRLADIDPKSSAAPKSMQEAVEKFFRVKNGDFSEIGDIRRREFAEQIQIVATGDKNLPNLLTRTSRNQKGKVAQGVACQRQEKRDQRAAHPFGDFSSGIL